MKWAHAMAVLFAATTMGAWAEADSKTWESVDDATAVYSDAILSRGDPNILRRAFDKAERGETLHVAVIGGSITEGAAAGAPGRDWGALFVSGWRKLFPKTKVEFLNAGVGATGSLVGAFRYSQHVSPFRPDVLAIEFSANDSDGDEARQTMEGLIRHALREGTAVVLLGMTQQNGTSAQASHLKAAERCGVPFVSYRDGMMRMIKEGRWQWKDFAADSVHPNRRGHALAGELMNTFVRDEFRRYKDDCIVKPAIPLAPGANAFEQGSFTPFSRVELTENHGFVPYKEERSGWGTGLMSTNAGDRIAFTFTGSAAAFLYRKGNLEKGMGCVQVTVDGQPLSETPTAFAKGIWWWWTPAYWLFRGKNGKHKVAIETLPAKKPGDPVGFRLAVLMVSP